MWGKQKLLNCCICWFSWCKYFHQGKFQSTYVKLIGSEISQIPGILTFSSWKLVLNSSSTPLPWGPVKTNISAFYLQRYWLRMSGVGLENLLFQELPASTKPGMLRAAFPKYVRWSPSLVNVNKYFRGKIEAFKWWNVKKGQDGEVQLVFFSVGLAKF